MNPNLQPIIESVQRLPLPDQLELLGEISRSLMLHYGKTSVQQDFWRPKTLNEIIEKSSAKAIDEINSLKVDFWPEDESADTFNDFIYNQRQEDISDTEL